MQPENAPYPMLVTLEGIVTEVRPMQPENTWPPISVTLEGGGRDPDFPAGNRMSKVFIEVFEVVLGREAGCHSGCMSISGVVTHV